MRGLRVPIVIGVLFGVLWISGLDATAQQNCPSARPTPDSAPPPPNCPSPTITLTFEPSRQPSFPPTDAPPTDPPLQVTGADLTRYVLIGAGLTLAGTGFVSLARKARSDES